MPLTGISPDDPIPITRREIVFAAGLGGGGAKPRKVLIYGNKTTAGSATADDIYGPILDDSDAVARAGRRSELYAEYKAFRAIDKSAEVYFGVITESGGVAASATFTFATNSSQEDTLEISVHGQIDYVSVSTGDTPTVVAAAAGAKILDMDGGSLQVTAADAVGVLTVTAAQKGPRGDNIIGNTPTRGVRIRFLGKTTNAMTITKGALTAGTTPDDATALLVKVATREFYYHVLPFAPTVGLTSTDNQAGEVINLILQDALPSVGKEQTVHIGLVGTQAQATTVATSAGANTVRAYFYRAENNDWTPAMIAAQMCAIIRVGWQQHPGYNHAGYTHTDATPFLIPAPYDKADKPTTTEIRADLNNGVSPLTWTAQGRPVLIRHITSRSLGPNNDNDYKAREGHVTSVMDFTWDYIRQLYAARRQPFVAADPVAGQKPVPKTTYPMSVKSMLFGVIDTLTGPKPLGVYDGPILAPDKVTQMKSAVVVDKIVAGISAKGEFFSVEHNLKAEYLIQEVGPAY